MNEIIEITHNCYTVNGHSVVFIPEINNTVCECPADKGSRCKYAQAVKMAKHKHIYKFFIKIGREIRNKCIICGHIRYEKILAY